MKTKEFEIKQKQKELTAQDIVGTCDQPYNDYDLEVGAK